ncbi:MAG: quinone oxidoreductase family protein [Candidatus Kapaibacteriota bacterium]
MKAVYLSQHGKPENLIYTENFEIPIPKLNEVLVKIQYTSINRIDITLRNGYESKNISPFSFPKILGSDALGEIESLGEIATENNFNKGDKVLILPYFYHNGNKYSLGFNYHGTYSEFISVPLTSIIKITSDLDLVNFVGLPTSGLIAYKCLEKYFSNELNKLLINPPKNLLIIGGNSGVGTYIIQLAKQLNFNVTSTAGNHKNVIKLKELGADEVFNHYDDDFKDILLKRYENHFNIVIDFLGGEFINLYLDLLKQNGEIINIGGILGKNINLNLQKLYSKNIKLSGKSIFEIEENYELTKIYMVNLIELIEKNKIINSINNVYKLDEIPKVHQIMENGVYFGKNIIRMY